MDYLARYHRPQPFRSLSDAGSKLLAGDALLSLNRYLKLTIPPIGATALELLALLLFSAPPLPVLQIRTLLALEALGVRSQYAHNNPSPVTCSLLPIGISLFRSLQRISYSPFGLP